MAFTQAVHESSQSLKRSLKTRLGLHKPNEAAQLQPVALAGASRKFCGSSQLCNAFAVKQCRQIHHQPSVASLTDDESECQYVLASGEPEAPRSSPQQTAELAGVTCRMCAQPFIPSHASAHRYPEFCSLDCKSAFLFGASAYDGDASESSTVSTSSERSPAVKRQRSKARRVCEWV